MRNPLKWLRALTFVCILFALAAYKANCGALLTFDDLGPQPGCCPNPPVMNGYGGLEWENFYLDWHGGMSVVARGQLGGIFDGGPYPPSAIFCNARFDLNYAYLTVFTKVRVQGLLGTNILYDNVYDLPTNSPTLVNFSYLGIDKALFLSEDQAQTFTMDNLMVNIDCFLPDCRNFVVSWGCNAYHFPMNLMAIAANGLCLKEDGTVVDVGREWNTNKPLPPIPDGLTNVIAIARGGDDPTRDLNLFSLALKADGTIVAWGSNTNGQLTIPSDLTNVIAISAGTYHSLALKADGTIASFGFGAAAIVPDGLTNIVSVAAGNGNSLALRDDGRVFAWGSGNTSGIVVLSNIIAIAAGNPACCAYSWVALSDDKFTYSYSFGSGEPSEAGGGSNVLAISLTQDGSGDTISSTFLVNDGTVGAGGYNFCNYGGRLVPPGLTNVVDVMTCYQGPCALVGHGPPALGPPVLSVGKDEAGFRVSVPTRSGRVYRLEYKDALESTSWTGLPLVAGNGDIRTLTDPAANGGKRFYRVRHWWHN